jgi:hypothetical protein
MATLVSGTGDPMNDIRNAIAQLQFIVNEIAGAKHDPEIHPKLKGDCKKLPAAVCQGNERIPCEGTF